MTKLEALVTIAQTLMRHRNPGKIPSLGVIARTVNECSKLVDAKDDINIENTAMVELAHRYGLHCSWLDANEQMNEFV